MGESASSYQVADLVAELTEAMHRNHRNLLQWTIAKLRPLSEGGKTRDASGIQDTDSRMAAVFLELLFAMLGAGRFDEPGSALGARLVRDEHANVTARQHGKQTLTGLASDLMTAAWFDLSGIDYMATTFVWSRSQDSRCLRLATDDGLARTGHSLDTARIAVHTPWAYTIETGSRTHSGR